MLEVFGLSLMHPTPFHSRVTGPQGSPCQFSFSPYVDFMLLIASAVIQTQCTIKLVKKLNSLSHSVMINDRNAIRPQF